MTQVEELLGRAQRDAELAATLNTNGDIHELCDRLRGVRWERTTGTGHDTATILDAHGVTIAAARTIGGSEWLPEMDTDDEREVLRGRASWLEAEAKANLELASRLRDLADTL